MPPKERKKYNICFLKDDGTLVGVLDVPDMEISFDTEEKLFNLPWFGSFNDSMEASFTFDLKRKPSVEIFFPKKHRRKASIARRRRKYHGRTKNVC